MPPETDVGNAHQSFTRCPSRIYWTTMSRTITTKTGSLETRWHRSSIKIRIWQMKFPRPIRHRRRNSRRTPSWPWSPRRWPHTCFSNTTTEQKEPPERKISPRGENHFSKRRSEDDNKSKSGKVMIDSKTKATKGESESESKSKNIMTDSKTKETKRKKPNVTTKADKAKAIKRTKNEIRTELERQKD
jgi:hypothetical protein